MSEFGRRNWRNFRIDLRSIVQPTIDGPHEIAFDALRVVSGQAANLWIVDQPYPVDLLPTLGFDELLDFGINLSAVELFIPARFDRWWIICGAAPANVTILSLFWNIRVPVTR